MKMSDRDHARLIGVNPKLFAVVAYAYSICAVQPMVIEGVRTLATQKAYFAAGKSKTMRSRHLDGHAVDLAPLIDLDGDGDLELSWNARDFVPLASAMKAASLALKIPIEWGGDWLTFHDAPHFQLPWESYP